MAVSCFGIEDYAGLSGVEASAELWRLEQDRRRIEHRITALIDAVDRSEAYADDGHRTAKNWAIGVTNWSASESAGFVRCARALRDLPTVAAAGAAGELSAEHLRAIAKVWSNPRVRDALPDHAELLTGFATSMRFDDFRIVLRRWESNADADGARRRDHDADGSRRASVDHVGDEYVVHANVGTAQGAIIDEIFQAACRREFETDCAHAGAGRPLARTAAQRSADALFHIFQAAANGGRGVEVVINLDVDLATFDDEVRRAAGATPPPPDPSTWTTRRCETIGGVPIDPAEMLAMAATGWIRRRVIDARGVTIDLGRKRRCFTSAARDALHLGEHHCAWNGCTVPAGLTEADHTDDWRYGGPTAPANGSILCPHHNRYKNRGYRLTRAPNGTWTTIRPDGSTVGRPPPPPEATSATALRRQTAESRRQ